MACRAPSRIGAVRFRPQAVIGTAIALTADDGVRVIEAPTVSPIGEGRVDIEEEETPIPGGLDPILGSYGETVELAVPIPVTASSELDADHALVRLFRACGCAVAISGGDATITPLLGGCIGTSSADDRIPGTLEWVQRNGLTHRWKDVIGAFTGLSSEGGGTITARFILQGTLDLREDTASMPTVNYPGQGVMLAARNAAITLGSIEDPGGLYSWELTTGITAQEVADQLSPSGLTFPFSYMSDRAMLTITGPQAADYSEEAWDAFLDMTSLGALQLNVTGQAADQVLRLNAPRPFSSPQGMGDEAGHRTDERELLLKPSGTTLPWSLILSEQAAP
jgi:hypothetical protein